MNSALRLIRASRGFTLIELLIAVLIIGVLAAIALPAFNKQRERAKDSKAQQGLEAGLRAAKAVYAEGETFPSGGLAALFSRAERSQSFADSAAFPASAGTISLERATANRLILRSISESGARHMLALDEPDSRVTRLAGSPSGLNLGAVTNLFSNPSAETNVNSWLAWFGPGSGVNPVPQTADGASGSASVEATGTAVILSTLYTAGFTVAQSGTASPGQDVFVRVAFKVVSGGGSRAVLSARYTNSGAYVSETQVDTQTVTLGRWQVLSGRHRVPAGANEAGFHVYTSQTPGTTPLPLTTVRADAALVALTDESISYFDGDSPAASWSGAAHASTSSGPGGRSWTP